MVCRRILLSTGLEIQVLKLKKKKRIKQTIQNFIFFLIGSLFLFCGAGISPMDSFILFLQTIRKVFFFRRFLGLCILLDSIFLIWSL